MTDFMPANHWRSTPPAIFPSLLGLFGLGLGWRKAAESFAIPGWIAEAILVVTLLIYIVAALCYVAKSLARPAVVAEDMATVPGRAGVGALTIGLLLLAVVVQPFSTGLAMGLLLVGLVGHGGLAVMAIRILVSLPADQRQVTPTWHLAFVAFIVGPISAVPMGLMGLSYAILWGTVAISVMIYAASLKHLSRTPPPLRPLLMIHLAPFSLFASVAAAMGHDLWALIFAILASGILVALAAKIRFLIAAGFSPLWGAFTFPLAAYAIAMLSLAPQSPILGGIGLLVLLVCSVLIPLIVLRVLRLWISGKLAAATKSAVA